MYAAEHPQYRGRKLWWVLFQQKSSFSCQRKVESINVTSQRLITGKHCPFSPLSYSFGRHLIRPTTDLVFSTCTACIYPRGLGLQECLRKETNAATYSLSKDNGVEHVITGAKAMLLSASTWSVEEELMDDDSSQWLADNERMLEEILSPSPSSLK